MRLTLVAVAAASTLLLGGCAAAHDPVPPGPTQADVDTAVARDLDAQWSAMNLPPSVAKPEVARVAFTSLDSWSYRQLDCYLAAGLDAHDVGGDFTVNGFRAGSPNGAVPYAASIAIFTCQAQYPRDPRLVGYLSDAQVLYMYDYFRGRLAPCLRLLGYNVPAAPGREHYLASVRLGQYWDPYYTARSTAILPTRQDFDRLDLQCAPLPDATFWAYHPFGWLQR
jgi:hypothetical protein